MSTDPSTYPNPIFRRENWLDLTGEWDFAFDDDDAGLRDRWFAGHEYDRKINVPYPYQAKLSGISETEHHKVVWYSRGFDLPESYAGKRVWLHIGAVDYSATVWVNGQEVGSDEGGYVPFRFEITQFLRHGENDLTVRVFDDPLDAAQPRGKQHPSGGRNRWHYTHITGIWQPVWLEATGEAFIDRFYVSPSLEPRGAVISLRVGGCTDGGLEVRATATADQVSDSFSEHVYDGVATPHLHLEEASLWSPDNPALCDLTLELLKDGEVIDTVKSYFGIRSVEILGNKILLNGEPLWLNMALVQGYWPDGLYVPPSPEDYVKDLEFCAQVGLNGIRMHQKVEDPRFLYWCDKMGFLVWGEMANAGEGHFSERAADIADRVWERAIERDFNHPCIITWAYCNETWMHSVFSKNETARYEQAYHKLKALDRTRPVVDNSGYLHVVTDIYDFHGPGADEEVIAWTEGGIEGTPPWPTMEGAETAYEGQPIVRSEWALGDFERGDESYYKAYESTVRQAAESGVFCGQCYVQLNDIEDELNGYLTYDRKWKVDPNKIADIHGEATRLYEARVQQ